MKYKEWLKEWLDYSVGSSTKKRTKALYASIVESHLSNLGEHEIDELSPIVLQQFVSVLLKSGNARTGQGLSANYVNLIITVLQNSLKSAYDMGLSSVYTAGKIRRPKVPESRVTCFSADEQRRIENTILGGKSQRLYGVILCLYTGLRIGELLALTWNDVDFRQRSLTVNKTCYYMKDDNGKFVRMTDTPKTETSTRVIPIPSQITPLLREWKKKSRSSYLVANGKKPITMRSYQRSFKIL